MFLSIAAPTRHISSQIAGSCTNMSSVSENSSVKPEWLNGYKSPQGDGFTGSTYTCKLIAGQLLERTTRQIATLEVDEDQWRRSSTHSTSYDCPFRFGPNPIDSTRYDCDDCAWVTDQGSDKCWVQVLHDVHAAGGKQALLKLQKDLTQYVAE